MRKISIYVVMFLFFVFAGNTHAMEVDLLGGIDIHGFISQGYMESQDNNYLANDSSDGTFAFNEIGINFCKQLADNLRLGLQLFSHDLGAIGNNDIVLDWAFADYRWKDWAGLRVGRIKAPHGLYNESRDVDMLRTFISLPQSVYPDIQRDSIVAVNGVGVYGDVPLGPVGGISYYVLAGTQDMEGDDDIGAVRQANSSGVYDVSDDMEFDEMYIGSLEWQAPVGDLPFVDSLRFKWTYRSVDFLMPGAVNADGAALFALMGLPLVEGDPLEISPEERYVNYVYSVEYTWQDLVVAAEYQQVRSQFDIYAPTLGASIFSNSLKNRGYYVSAAYRVNDWFEVGGYWSKYYDNSDDKNGEQGAATGNYMVDHQSRLRDYALSLRFDINEYWVAKVEGHLMNGAALCLSIDNDEYEKKWYMYAAKLTFSF